MSVIDLQRGRLIRLVEELRELRVGSFVSRRSGWNSQSSLLIFEVKDFLINCHVQVRYMYI